MTCDISLNSIILVQVDIVDVCLISTLTSAVTSTLDDQSVHLLKCVQNDTPKWGHSTALRDIEFGSNSSIISFLDVIKLVLQYDI